MTRRVADQAKGLNAISTFHGIMLLLIIAISISTLPPTPAKAYEPLTPENSPWMYHGIMGSELTQPLSSFEKQIAALKPTDYVRLDGGYPYSEVDEKSLPDIHCRVKGLSRQPESGNESLSLRCSEGITLGIDRSQWATSICELYPISDPTKWSFGARAYHLERYGN